MACTVRWPWALIWGPLQNGRSRAARCTCKSPTNRMQQPQPQPQLQEGAKSMSSTNARTSFGGGGGVQDGSEVCLLKARASQPKDGFSGMLSGHTGHSCKSKYLPAATPNHIFKPNDFRRSLAPAFLFSHSHPFTVRPGRTGEEQPKPGSVQGTQRAILMHVYAEEGPTLLLPGKCGYDRASFQLKRALEVNVLCNALFCGRGVSCSPPGTHLGKVSLGTASTLGESHQHFTFTESVCNVSVWISEGHFVKNKS